MQKENVLLYPCGKESIPVIKHLNECSTKYRISSIVAPRSWAKEGADLGFLDNRADTGLIITNDFEEALKSCDLVLFLDTFKRRVMYGVVLEKMQQTLRQGKPFHCTFPLQKEDVDALQVVARETNCSFTYFSTKPEGRITDPGLYDIDVPVVFIGDLYLYSHSTDALLSITEGLKEKGYNAVGVTPDRNGDLVGYQVIPDFFTQPGKSEDEKVVYFNKFVKEIEKEYQPDIILIALPGPLMMYAKRITVGYGILPIMAATVVEPDFFIVCAALSAAHPAFMEQISSHLAGKIGIGIDALVISSFEPDYTVSISKRIMVSSAVNAEKLNSHVHEKIANMRLPTYYIHEQEGMNRLVEQLINLLG